MAGMSSGSSALRLRQVCLVAPDLEPAATNLKQIFGLEECHRDPAVGAYGLENVLLPVGSDFLEIVAPTRDGTAAGRFLARNGARHGYMIIMDCDDPARRQAHCEGVGVRTAHRIEREAYLGVQLHPRDTGGAMLEFNRTAGGGDPLGPYGPAGAHWQSAIRTDVSRSLLAVEMECADPGGFAAHWGRILERPAQALAGRCWRIRLDAGEIVFLPGAGEGAVLAGLVLEVVDRERVTQVARARGCLNEAGEIEVCGVRFRLRQAQATRAPA